MANYLQTVSYKPYVGAPVKKLWSISDFALEMLQQTVGERNKSKRWSFLHIIGWNTEVISQVTRCRMTLENGSLPQTPGKATTPRGDFATVERQSGLFKERPIPNGFCPIQVPFYGSMANVSISESRHLYAFDGTDGSNFPQRAQAKLFFGTVKLSILILKRTDGISQFYNHPGN